MPFSASSSMFQLAPDGTRVVGRGQDMPFSANSSQFGICIVTFRLRKDSLASLHWVAADEVFIFPKRDRAYNAECPCEIVQIRPLKRYPPPPFQLDRRFKAAFAAALRQFGIERMRDRYSVDDSSTKKAAPPKRFMKLLAGHFKVG
jgi:hypothetical protein